MPDDIIPSVDPAAHNAEIKAKLEAQGAETVGGATAEELQHSSDALDALAAAVVEKKADPAPEPEPKIEPGVAQNGEVVPDAAATEAAAKVEADRVATTKRSDEFFKDSPALPPGASPKASEAFTAVKVKAAQEIVAREAQLAEVQKKLDAAEAKLAEGPSPELAKELEEHRQWRAKLDVDADPKFKEFDKQVSASQEFIYAQLRKSAAITPEIIEQIKKLGGPENVNLDKIFAAVKDATLQRLVESKVADIEMAKFNKEQAITDTKKNIEKYVADQRKSYEENVGSHNKVTQQHFTQLAAKIPWFAEKPVDSKADEPTRKAAEAHNTFLKETKAQLAEALKDDSAEMRAIMLAGIAQLLYLQKIRTGELAAAAAVKKALDEANAKLEKFTTASVSRLRETGAAPGGQTNGKPKTMDLSGNASSALDAIATQINEERARKASA